MLVLVKVVRTVPLAIMRFMLSDSSVTLFYILTLAV